MATGGSWCHRLLFGGLREKVGDTFMNGVINTACGTEESAFKDLFFILAVHSEFKIAFAHRAAEDVHE